MYKLLEFDTYDTATGRYYVSSTLNLKINKIFILSNKPFDNFIDIENIVGCATLCVVDNCLYATLEFFEPYLSEMVENDQIEVMVWGLGMLNADNVVNNYEPIATYLDYD